ncbi:ankyrin [Lizonia empirigonia]|nr:ankyrin [Lizonia empirigonia]
MQTLGTIKAKHPFTQRVQNRLDVAQMLISRGSDVGAIASDEHWLSLMFAATDPGSYQYWHSSPARPYTKATTSGDHELVRYLVERGTDVHATTATGQNVLHAACWESGLSWGREMKVPIIDLLVINGADPNAQDEHGATPLYYLMRDHNTLTCVPDVYNALLKKGVDPGAMNNEEQTPAGQVNPIKWFLDDAGLLQNTPPKPYTTIMRGLANVRANLP